MCAQQGDVFPYRLPPHSPHLGTLAAARTEVVGKLGAAVTAMLHTALVAVGIVQLRLLPAAETAVELFQLFFVHNNYATELGAKVQKISRTAVIREIVFTDYLWIPKVQILFFCAERRASSD